MNVGEYGITFNLNVNFTISGFTSLSLAITRPNGTVITAVNPAVSVGAAPLVTSGGTFLANQYSIYNFAIGDLTEAGTYGARLTYTDANKRLIAESVNFEVTA